MSDLRSDNRSMPSDGGVVLDDGVVVLDDGMPVIVSILAITLTLLFGPSNPLPSSAFKFTLFSIVIFFLPSFPNFLPSSIVLLCPTRLASSHSNLTIIYRMRILERQRALPTMMSTGLHQFMGIL